MFHSAEPDAVGLKGILKPLDRSRILVVDDSSGIRELFRIILASALPDRVIDTAENGQVAVSRFDHDHHAVLLMDLNMPVMDGEAAYMEIDRLCRTKGWVMPSVVFCTGYAPPAMIRDLMVNHSPHKFLPKPISEEDLVGAIKSCLA
jgi:CheY-like chemotaxis protein